MATRIWVSPALCGCELSIAAVWASDPHPDGKMYQHPASAPGVDNAGKSRNTIQKIEIVSQCAAHAGWETAVNWNPLTTMTGYMDIPAAPTPGEALYINHWRFTALSLGLTLCTCKPAQCHDRETDAIGVVQHPHHTRRCPVHATDDDQHTEAFKIQRAQSVLRELHAAVGLTLDADGKILVDTSALDATDQAAFAQAVHVLPEAALVKGPK